MLFNLITLLSLIKADSIEIFTPNNIKYNYSYNTINVIDVMYRQQHNGMLYIYSTIVSLINSNNITLQSVTTNSDRYSNITTQLQFPYIQQYEELNNQNFTISIIGLGTYNLFNGSDKPTKLLLNTTDNIFVEMNFTSSLTSSFTSSFSSSFSSSFLSVFVMFLL
jgi:hypothetical protein